MKIFIAATLFNLICYIMQLNGVYIDYDAPFVLFITLGAVGAVIFSIYKIAQKRYYPTFGPGKAISYEFTPKEVRVEATGYSAQLSWEQVQKVEQLKNWILIYTKGVQANAIHKRSFSDTQLEELHNIVSAHKHITLR